MILVDSNIIIDLARPDPTWAAWSEETLAAARDRDEIAINQIIYAEISVTFDTLEHIDKILGSDFRRLDLPYAAAFLAGKAHREYRRRGGARTMVLPDFFIGAHAAVEGFTLLTRDPRRYRNAFPTLKLIAP